MEHKTGDVIVDMDYVYIVCIDVPEDVVANNCCDSYDIHEVFNDYRGACRYLEQLGFEQYETSCFAPRWQGQSPLFDQPEEDGEYIVDAWIVERSLTYDFKGEDRELEALILGEELRTGEE